MPHLILEPLLTVQTLRQAPRRATNQRLHHGPRQPTAWNHDLCQFIPHKLQLRLIERKSQHGLAVFHSLHETCLPNLERLSHYKLIWQDKPVLHQRFPRITRSPQFQNSQLPHWGSFQIQAQHTLAQRHLKTASGRRWTDKERKKAVKTEGLAPEYDGNLEGPGSLGRRPPKGWTSRATPIREHARSHLQHILESRVRNFHRLPQKACQARCEVWGPASPPVFCAHQIPYWPNKHFTAKEIADPQLH